MKKFETQKARKAIGYLLVICGFLFSIVFGTVGFLISKSQDNTVMLLASVGSQLVIMIFWVIWGSRKIAQQQANSFFRIFVVVFMLLLFVDAVTSSLFIKATRDTMFGLISVLGGYLLLLQIKTRCCSGAFD